jgi:hypothetical protein
MENNQRKIPGTLRTEVFARTMSQEQLDALYADYRRGLKRQGTGTNREDNLAKEVTQREKDVIEAYLTDMDQKANDILASANISWARMQSAAMRLLYQNPDVLNRLLGK